MVIIDALLCAAFRAVDKNVVLNDYSTKLITYLKKFGRILVFGLNIVFGAVGVL